MQLTDVLIVYTMLQKSAVDELNDGNNSDEAHSNINHFTTHPPSDDCNKADFSNTMPDWPKRQNDDIKTSNISYKGGVMQYLLILVYFLKQFVFYQQRQTCLTFGFTFASVCLDNLCVASKFDDIIQQWKMLFNVIIQYLLEIYHCMEELRDDMVEQWKEVQQTVVGQCRRCLCGITSSPIMRKRFNLTYFSPLPIDLNWLDYLRHDVALRAVVFGDGLLDNVALLLCDVIPTRLAPNLFVSIFGSIPCYHKWLKNYSHVGRQASDRNGSNSGKQSHSESSTQSSTSSPTTEGINSGGVRRDGIFRNSGGGSGGDDDDENNGWNRSRKFLHAYNSPSVLECEEESKDNDIEREEEGNFKPFPVATASYSTSGKRKAAKTAEPIIFELTLKGSNGPDMFAVSSPMMNRPLSASESEQSYSPTTTPSNQVRVGNFCESYHDKLLYSDDFCRSYWSLRKLCLPCEPVVVPTLPPPIISQATLLPPPGGGSDIQFKETLMILCSVIATVYCYSHDYQCYFDCADLDMYNISVKREEDTGKITAVYLHARLHQLQKDCDKDVARADTNKALVSLANDIYSPYQQTLHKDLAEGILTIMDHCPPYEDLDVLHALLVYLDSCPPFADTTINFVL